MRTEHPIDKENDVLIEITGDAANRLVLIPCRSDVRDCLAFKLSSTYPDWIEGSWRIDCSKG